MHTLLPFCDYTVAGLEAELPRGKEKVSKLQLLPLEPRMASVHLRHQPYKRKRKRIIKKKKKKKEKQGNKGLYCSISASLENRFNSGCSEKYFGRFKRCLFEKPPRLTAVRRARKVIRLASIPPANLCSLFFIQIFEEVLLKPL